MKILSYIFIFLLAGAGIISAQSSSVPDFTWGNAFYFNIKKGEKITFNSVEIELLKLDNHFNFIRVGGDTLTIKVSRRSLPELSNGLRIFVADNQNVKALTTDNSKHGLLTKDALICLSDFNQPLLDPNRFIFPVSFNDGYIWSTEEDSHMFSYLGHSEWISKDFYRSHEGIDFDLHDARGKQKHWLVALENSTVVWVEDKNLDTEDREACILLESESQPGIYYVYEHLFNKNVTIKKGQKLVRGQPIGTIWGDDVWGHLHFAVVKSDTVPSYKNRYDNLINGFPQVFELYYSQLYSFSKSFTKGRIRFGQLRSLNGNQKNALAYEEYSGKGWLIESWNPADKVEWVEKEDEGNVRLKKELFAGSKAVAVNPHNWFDYEISVPNGIYRIRAKVGDLVLPSWQKIEFEGVAAGTFSLPAGEQKWTNERIVKVDDRKLTIRVHIDETNEKNAGISEIVFQQAY